MNKGKKMTAMQRRAMGGSFFGKLADIGKSVYKNVLKPLYGVAKDTKVISKGADALGFSNVGNLARKVGLGKKRKRGGASAVKF
jgi:hypothetical protein